MEELLGASFSMRSGSYQKKGDSFLPERLVKVSLFQEAKFSAPQQKPENRLKAQSNLECNIKKSEVPVYS
jgi:hypothetical protein